MKNPAISIFLLILAVGCTKESLSPGAGNISVVGNDGVNVSYWKNRSQVIFTTSSIVNCGFVSGDDAYVGGSVVTTGLSPCYSKNDTTILLSGTGAVYSLFVSDSSVYAAGYVSNGTTISPSYWKDGVRKDLGTGKNGAATSIVISGQDVYVGGYLDSTACFWKNGVAVKMPSFTDTVTVSNGMFVSGSDVYMVGSDGGVGLYWQNQLQYPLALSEAATVAYGTCITVSGSDVIVGGYQTGGTAALPTTWATYWINGIPTVINQSGVVNSIYSLDGRIYSAGHLIDGTNIIAAYWIGTDQFILPHTKNNSNVLYVTAQ